MQTTAQDLIERAAKYDLGLAADIRAFAKAREFGLVFEHNRPEAMRLYGKKISKGDTVHILAPRGKVEKPANKVPWRVARIEGSIAHLKGIEDPESNCDVELSELVAVAAFEEPIYAGLKEVGRVERGGDKPYQVVINGENYHALEALLFAYAGKADCIYIDPPYNTGARDWKYNNDYVDGTDEYRHSKWLALMERRLNLARDLLNPQRSVLIVTIDEKEYLRLGLLLEQVFPESNIQMISSIVSRKGSNRRTEFSRCVEYIFFVMIGDAVPASHTHDMNGTGNASNSDSPVCWQYLKRRGTSRGASRAGRPGLFYPIFINRADGSFHSVGEPLDPDLDRHSIKIPEGTWAAYPLRPNGDEGCWQIKPSRFLEQLDEGTCYLSNVDESKESAQFLYLKDADRRKVLDGTVKTLGREANGKRILEGVDTVSVRPKDVWSVESHDATQGTNMLNAIFGSKRFSYPKSLYAVEDAIRFFVSNNPEALVVDFFAGSGTTAHAVMRLNHQDGGRRRSISVTNNEVSEDEEKRFTERELRHGDEEWERYGIARYTTWPRVEAAITGLTPDGRPIEGEYLPMETKVEYKSRVIKQIDYANPELMRSRAKKDVTKKKKMLTQLSNGALVQRLLDDNADFAIADDSEIAILFNDSAVDDWLEALDGQDQVKTIYVVTDNNRLFKKTKTDIEDLLGKYEEEVPAPSPMANGFEENAIFFDLTYQNPVVVDLDGAYEEIAPLLWMRAGCKGPIIDARGDGIYQVAETYAILFDYAFAQDFVTELESKPEIQTVYVVTDDEGRYQSINHALKGRDVVQLYESYLRSFEIAAEGALR